MELIDKPTNARSRRTRDALLRSTRMILEAEGLEGLTIAAVAERAGVSRRSVYLHFASIADLLACTFDHVAEVEDLAGSLAEVWAAPDARSALDRWARHLADYHPRVMAVDRAMNRVQDQSEAVLAHRSRVHGAQRVSCERLADWLAEESILAPGWSAASAADMLFALISTEMMERLLDERGWSQDDLAAGLSRLMCGALTQPR